MDRKCKDCQRYIEDVCSGVIPTMVARGGCNNFCYSKDHIIALVKEAKALCEVAECAPGFIERMYTALEPFRYI